MMASLSKGLERLSSTSYFSALMARRRLFLGLSFVFLILIALSLTDTEDMNQWSHTVDGSSFGHISSMNGTRNATYIPTGPPAAIIPTGPGYKRPGYDLPLAGGIPLRILALGASTTRGDESFDNNGFRRPIRDRLTSIGNPVNFVGSVRYGNMSDNDIEAYPGARTGVMHHHAEKVVPQTKPNLVLLDLGANDCFQDFDMPNFYKRYYALVNYLLEASPRSTVVMGTLIPATETERWNAHDRMLKANVQLRRLHRILEAEGKPVVLAEMSGPDGIQPGNLAHDGMHPTSAGYEMMGRILLQAIFEADARGYLRPAEPVYGIIPDGDLERQDEAYGAWVQRKEAEARAHEREEKEAISHMTEELARWTADVELKKTEAIDRPAKLAAPVAAAPVTEQETNNIAVEAKPIETTEEETKTTSTPIEEAPADAGAAIEQPTPSQPPKEQPSHEPGHGPASIHEQEAGAPAPKPPAGAKTYEPNLRRGIYAGAR